MSGARDEVDFAAMVCGVWIVNVWDTDVCNIDICGCYGRVANKHHMTYDAGYRRADLLCPRDAPPKHLLACKPN